MRISRSLASVASIFCHLASIALVLSALSSPAEPADGDCIGMITSSDNVMVNGLTASAGTTLFLGDTVEAREGSALVQFADGNRLELVKVKATFKRQGERPIIWLYTGLLRFNFKEGDDTLILTPRYRLYIQDKGSPTIGGLAVNQNGQLAVSVCKGKLAANDGRRIEEYEATPDRSLIILKQAGIGRLQKGQDTLTDRDKFWRPDELRGKLVQVGDEIREILWNGENSLTVDGVWERTTGWHYYEIEDPPGNPPLSTTAITDPSVSGISSCMTPATVHFIIPAAAGAAGAAVGLRIESKSESSRFDGP